MVLYYEIGLAAPVSVQTNNENLTWISSGEPKDVVDVIAASPIFMPTYNGDFAGIQSDVDKDIVETDSVSVPRNNEHISCALSDVNQDAVVDHAFMETENETTDHASCDLDQCLINVVSAAMEKKNQQLSSILYYVHQDVVDMATVVGREKK